MGKSNQRWAEEELDYLAQMCESGAETEAIMVAFRYRSPSSVKAAIARIPLLKAEREFDALSPEEKMTIVQSVCEYYMKHDPEENLWAVLKKHSISQSYAAQVFYSPSAAQRQEIAEFQDAYDHFREIHKIGSRYHRLSAKEWDILKSMVDSGISVERIAKALDCTEDYIGRTVKKYLKQKESEAPEPGDDQCEPKEAVSDAEPESMGCRREITDLIEDGKSDPSVYVKPEHTFYEVNAEEYLDCAEMMVESYNEMVSEYNKMKAKLAQMDVDLDRVSQAIELLKK